MLLILLGLLLTNTSVLHGAKQPQNRGKRGSLNTARTGRKVCEKYKHIRKRWRSTFLPLLSLLSLLFGICYSYSTVRGSGHLKKRLMFLLQSQLIVNKLYIECDLQHKIHGKTLICVNSESIYESRFQNIRNQTAQDPMKTGCWVQVCNKGETDDLFLSLFVSLSLFLSIHLFQLELLIHVQASCSHTFGEQLLFLKGTGK